MTIAPLNLAEIEAPIQPVTFPDGSTYPVLPMDASTAQLAVKLRGLAGEEFYDLMFQIVERIVPQAPLEKIQKLTLAQLDCIVALATNQQEKVEAYMQLAAGKAEATDAASTSETPSPTPSPESRRATGGGRRKSGAALTG